MEELQTYIKSYFVITSIDADKIIPLFLKTTLKKGAYYVKEHQFCNKMSFVKSGLIRIYANAGNKEITQWISTQGFFVTELSSFVFDEPSRYNLQALSDCELYTISKEDYKKLPTILSNWGTIERQFMSACFVMLEDRVFRHLSLNAEERYDQFFENNKELFHQVPLQYIASMLGMSPETFSRIRNKKIS